MLTHLNLVFTLLVINQIIADEFHQENQTLADLIVTTTSSKGIQCKIIRYTQYIFNAMFVKFFLYLGGYSQIT